MFQDTRKYEHLIEPMYKLINELQEHGVNLKAIVLDKKLGPNAFVSSLMNVKIRSEEEFNEFYFRKIKESINKIDLTNY